MNTLHPVHIWRVTDSAYFAWRWKQGHRPTPPGRYGQGPFWWWWGGWRWMVVLSSANISNDLLYS